MRKNINKWTPRRQTWWSRRYKLEFEEIKTYLTEHSEDEDVKGYFDEITKLTPEKIDELIATEEGKKEFDKRIDQRITGAIKTNDKKWKDRVEVETEKLYIERHPGETEADKKLREAVLQVEVEKKRNETLNRKNIAERCVNANALHNMEDQIELIGKSGYDADKISEHFTGIKEAFELIREQERVKYTKENMKDPGSGDGTSGKWKSKEDFYKAMKEGRAKYDRDEYERLNPKK